MNLKLLFVLVARETSRFYAGPPVNILQRRSKMQATLSDSREQDVVCLKMSSLNIDGINRPKLELRVLGRPTESVETVL